jgi:hypothetical protein
MTEGGVAGMTNSQWIGRTDAPSLVTALAVANRFTGDSGQEQVEGAGDEALHILAVHHGVEEAVFEKEFGALEAFGKFLAYGLFNYAWACETDERAGFGDI